MDPYLTPHTKINSCWVIGLNIKPKTIKCLEKNLGENICDLGETKISQDDIPSTVYKRQIGKLDLIKIKNSSKYTGKSMKKQIMYWKEIYAKDILDEPAFKINNFEENKLI